MNKKYFLWLQEIANINEKFNINIYLRIIKEIGNNYNLYNNLDENLLIRLKVDKSIINCLKDNNIKEKINMLYSKINELNLDLFTLNEYYPSYNIKSFKFEIPFCIITSKKVNMNSKNIYIYYSEYYTKFATNIIKYFSKIISKENCNAISSIEYENILNVEICDFNNIGNISSNCIILPKEKYASWFIFCFIDALILIEARYEEKIVNLVDNYLELGKDIYVVPSNIFSKNSYFSNYLIKQGADVILNKHDLKFILRKNIR